MSQFPKVFRAVVLAALAVAPAAQAADPVATSPSPSPVATVANRTPIAAGGGWVLWSEKTGDAWALTGMHAGQVAGLPVATNDAPFDVTVGTGANGQPVAVYTRCEGAPDLAAIREAAGPMLLGDPRPSCVIHTLDLASGQETVPPVPRTPTSSDGTPAIHGGSIAFARLKTVRSDVPRIQLWNPTTPNRLETLAGGPLARTARPAATIQGLAFNGERVAYIWQAAGPNVEGDVGWEMRSTAVSGGPSALLDIAIAGEACAGSPNHLLTRPTFIGVAPAWVKITDQCYDESAKLVTQRGKHRRAGVVAGSAVLDLAGDATGRYGLFGTERPSEGFPICSPTCEIRPIAPMLKSVRTPRLSSPFL